MQNDAKQEDTFDVLIIGAGSAGSAIVCKASCLVHEVDIRIRVHVHRRALLVPVPVGATKAVLYFTHSLLLICICYHINHLLLCMYITYSYMYCCTY